MHRFRRYQRNLLLLGASTLVALIAAEAGLRMAGVNYLRQFNRDNERGFVLVPNQEGWYYTEGCAYVRNNSAGFRDDERSLQKPPDTVRIALLGDSMIQAREVAKEERVTEMLEARLKSAGAPAATKFEVLNFGVSGYGTADELLVFRKVVSRYSPDIVLLAFFAGNDLINNVESLERKANRPYMVLQNGLLTLDTSFRQAPEHIMTWRKRLAYAAIDRSRLFQVAFHVRARLIGGVEQAERSAIAASAGLGVGISRLALTAPTLPEWREAWEVTEAILVQMNQEVQAQGARFMVVTLSMAPQVNPNADARERLRVNLRVPDLFYPDDRIRRLGDSHGFPVLNLARPFQEYAQSTGTFLHGFSNTQLGTGHWNAAGHRLAAEIIAQEMIRLTSEASARTAKKN